MDEGEVVEIWNAASKVGWPFAPLFRLLLTTGQRREEVAGLRWEELDRSTLTWMLPGARSKNGRAHLVPLSQLARSILDGHAGSDDWPTEGLIFTTTGKTPVSGHSRAKRRLDAFIAESRLEAGLQPLKPWRVHDLRRTVATSFQKLGIRFEVTEAVLNHQSGARSGVAGIYQRHDWADEKRFALEKWGTHLTVLVQPDSKSNVVPISSKPTKAHSATARP